MRQETGSGYGWDGGVRGIGSILSSLAVVVFGGALAILMSLLRRSWRQRGDGPVGFECGCRVVHGHVPGLAHRWRPGQAHVEDGRVVWRRRPWWWQQVRLAPATVEPVVHHQRRILDAVVLALFIDLDTVVVPVTLRSGERLELAVLRLELDYALEQLHQLTDP